MADLIISGLIGTLRSFFRVGTLRLVSAVGDLLEVRNKAGTQFRAIRTSGVSLRTATGVNDLTIGLAADPATPLSFTLPAVAGTSGACLSTDGAGNLSWVRQLRVLASGTVTLSGGTATVTTTAVTGSTPVLLSHLTVSGTFGALATTARVSGTSFTVSSSSPTDASTVAWVVVQP